MVADKLAKQEEEGILCSPTLQIENVNEEEMDTSISHHKRKVRTYERVLPPPQKKRYAFSHYKWMYKHVIFPKKGHREASWYRRLNIIHLNLKQKFNFSHIFARRVVSVLRVSKM